jgi:hypothetical protein
VVERVDTKNFHADAFERNAELALG